MKQEIYKYTIVIYSSLEVDWSQPVDELFRVYARGRIIAEIREQKCFIFG